MGAILARPEEPQCGEWQELAPGVRLARLAGVSGLGEAVYLIRGEPHATATLGAALPVSEILALEGQVAIDGETYHPGDYVEAAETGVLSDGDHTGFLLMATAAEDPGGDDKDD